MDRGTGHAFFPRTSLSSPSMQQKPPPRQKTSARLLPFLAGGVAAAVTLGACDRPGSRADIAAANATPQTASPMNVEPPRDAVPARAPTPLPPRKALADTVITSRIKSEILGDP